MKGAFAAAILCGIGFVAVFIWWPHDYVEPGKPGSTMYTLYTPVLGVSFGAAVAALAIGVISYSNSLYPTETAAQRQHLGGSGELDQRTATAHFTAVATSTGLNRRRGARRLLLGGLAAFGGMLGCLALGGFIRNPWQGRDRAALWTTGWGPGQEKRCICARPPRIRPKSCCCGQTT